MSLSIFASLRAPSGRCLRHATTGLLSIRVHSRSASFHVHAIVPFQALQRRYQSSLEPKSNPKKSQDAKPKMSFRQFVGRALVASLRKVGYAFTPTAIKQAYRDYPSSTVISLLLFVFVIGSCVYLVTEFFQIFYNKELSVYPEPVANSLRRAIHATIVKPDPEMAKKMYTRALEQATELGLDPFSDEVLGIKIRIAAWLEQIKNPLSAAQTLEVVVADCLKWIHVMEQAVKDGKVDKEGQYIAGSEGIKQSKAEASSEDTTLAKGAQSTTDGHTPENLWHKRQRLLAKAIQTSVKLGELYAEESVLDGGKSHKHLVWAVEQSLNEFHRRRVEGNKPGEDYWLTPAELGASIESLAREYERRSQYQFVIPLYFHALRLCEIPCHRVVIMNNLSAAFAQHPLYSPGPAEPDSDALKALFTDPMPRSREECLEAARNWARNAYLHAQDVQSSDRTPECDEACAVALCNWGDVAGMMGKVEVARKKYEQCVEMSTKLGFAEGVQQAKEGLKKLASTSAKSSSA